VTMFFGNIVNILPLVREGKLRAFAVTSLKRTAAEPDVPTMAEMGYPGFEAVPLFVLLAPAATDRAIIDKIYKQTMIVLAMSDVKKSFSSLAIDMIGNSPEEFAAVMKRETVQWAQVIKAAGIKIAN